MESDRQPQRAGSPTRVAEHAAHGKERGQASQDQPQVAPLPEHPGQIEEAGQPVHLAYGGGLLGRPQEVQRREERRDEHQGDCRRGRPADESLERPAEKPFLRARHRRRRDDEAEHRTPGNLPHRARRIQTQPPEDDAHQPKQPSGDHKTEDEVLPPARVGFQAEVAPPADPQRADRRPQQDQRGNEHRPVEITSEFDPGEPVERPPRSGGVPGPVQRRGKQCSEEQRAEEVGGDF